MKECCDGFREKGRATKLDLGEEEGDILVARSQATGCTAEEPFGAHARTRPACVLQQTGRGRQPHGHQQSPALDEFFGFFEDFYFEHVPAWHDLQYIFQCSSRLFRDSPFLTQRVGLRHRARG